MPVGHPVPPPRNPAQSPRPLFPVYGASRCRPVVRLYWVRGWLAGWCATLRDWDWDWTWCRSFRKLGEAGVFTQDGAGEGVVGHGHGHLAHGGGADAYVSLFAGELLGVEFRALCAIIGILEWAMNGCSVEHMVAGAFLCLLLSSLSILLICRDWEFGSKTKDWVGLFPSSHDFYLHKRKKEKKQGPSSGFRYFVRSPPCI